MADIFISYASEDRSRVEPLAKDLNEHGWSVWWDRRIEVGQSFEAVIEQALDEASCVIVVWSVKSINSEWVRAEAAEGLRKRILAPVLIEEVNPPLRYRQLQTVSLVGWDGSTTHLGYRQLIQALISILGSPMLKDSISSKRFDEQEVEDEIENRFPPKREPQKDEREPAQPDPDKGETIGEPPSLSSRLAPGQKRFILGIVTLAVILALSVAGWFHFSSPQYAKTFENRIGMKFVLIPAGIFTMGSPRKELGRGNDEKQHEVKITKPFYLQTTEVTQGQWEKIMGDKPWYFKDCGDSCPAEMVSWEDAQKFIKKLNDMEEDEVYRLPTEAEWEYASRAGTTTLFFFGDDASKLDEYSWYGNNSKGQTHPVETKKPNPWGLYHIYGNVWEWCQDWYGEYPSGPVADPRGPTTGAFRVIRGGSWDNDAHSCRSANRGYIEPDSRGFNVGFRLSRSVTLGP